MADADFTQDVQANGEFAAAADAAAETEVKPKVEPGEAADKAAAAPSGDGGGAPDPPSAAAAAIPRGTDDNSAEDRKLFVGGLSWETREPQLKEYFERFGEVESVNLKMDPMTGKSRCFAFVVYKEPAHLQRAFAAGEHAINSKKVDVKRARAKPGKIFVGGLKPDMTDEDIRTHFEQYGNIIEFEMPYDKVKKQRKGFGFITFEREETMKELIKRGKVTIGEHDVDLRKATPKTDFGGFGGGMGMMMGGGFRGGGGGGMGGGGGGGGGWGGPMDFYGGYAADYYGWGGGYDYYGWGAYGGGGYGMGGGGGGGSAAAQGGSSGGGASGSSSPGGGKMRGAASGGAAGGAKRGAPY